MRILQPDGGNHQRHHQQIHLSVEELTLQDVSEDGHHDSKCDRGVTAGPRSRSAQNGCEAGALEDEPHHGRGTNTQRDQRAENRGEKQRVDVGKPVGQMIRIAPGIQGVGRG
jgi:hypothetical protein